MTEIAFGQPLPSGLDYAVSFGIPTWNTAIGYAEHKPEVLSQMVTGYPRYYPQPPIQGLCDHFLQKYGSASESCRPFPSYKVANECLQFARSVLGSKSKAHLEVETFNIEQKDRIDAGTFQLKIAAVLASDEEFDIVREYWKLRGECVSSRLATSLNQLIEAEKSGATVVQQEVGINLSLAKTRGDAAKDIIRNRIVANHYKPFGLPGKNLELQDPVADPDRDVHLVSSGMSSIFTVRNFLTFWESKRASAAGSSGNDDSTLCDTAAIFGFPFKDTQVIMRELGTCKFYGFGDSRDIAGLKNYLETESQRILAVFVETPSNPLLNMPDLKSLRQLADKHGFAVVVDDTIGGLNVNVMPYADIVCTSLTKLFNGSSNVMGGSIIINPKSPFHSAAIDFFGNGQFEDLLASEDAITLELNSRDYDQRTLRCNKNTETLINQVLLPEVGKTFKKVYYPSLSSQETLANYDSVRSEGAGYGSMFSLALYSDEEAEIFYDSLKVFKGPSNGTNFTLACPYVHLAHHSELEDVSQYGADPNLVRLSVGLEDTQWLLDVFTQAIEQVKRKGSHRT